MGALAAIIISALVLGALYSLLASGLALVWSTLGVFNYAHGAVLMLGAYMAWTITTQLGLPLFFGAILAVLASGLLGIAFQRLFVSPFLRRASGTFDIMVVTLAVAAVAEGVSQLIWGPTNRQIKGLEPWGTTFFGQEIGGAQTVMMFVGPISVAAVALWLRYSRLGTQVRSVEQNPELAKLIGIRHNMVYATVFFIAAGLAGLSGVFYGSIYYLTPTVGNEPLLAAFVILVFGGTQSLFGTIFAAYIVGLIEAISNYMLGLQWTPIVVFVLMILVMLCKPEGLVSKKGRVS